MEETRAILPALTASRLVDAGVIFESEQPVDNKTLSLVNRALDDWERIRQLAPSLPAAEEFQKET